MIRVIIELFFFYEFCIKIKKMKNTLVTALILMNIFSCKKEKIDPNIESNVMLEEPAPKFEIPVDEGLALIQGADCLTCHKLDGKLVGPSYKEVAAKYADNAETEDKLASKIIEGGKGNWGEIPMSAHVGMSKETAKKMVKYILSHK